MFQFSSHPIGIGVSCSADRQALAARQRQTGDQQQDRIQQDGGVLGELG